MTRQEIWVEAMTHAINLPEDDIKAMVAVMKANTPTGKWDEEIHGDELEMWRSGLKAEAPQMKAWALNCMRIYGERNGKDPKHIKALIDLGRQTL